MQLREATLLIAATLLCSVCEGANILVYLAVASPSHKFALIPYVNGLVDRGHNVTMVSPVPSKGSQKFEDVAPEKVMQVVLSKMVGYDVYKGRSPAWIMGPSEWMPYFSTESCQAFLDSPEAIDFISGRRKFDLVVIDPLANECALPLAYINNAPHIYFVTAAIYPWLPPAFGLPPAALFKGSILIPKMTDISNVWHRLITAVVDTFWNACRQWYTFPKIQKAWEQRLGRTLPSLSGMEYNTSLLLLNTDSSVEDPFPYFQNIINVGGIHLTPPKPLPKDLETIASGNKEGFILFGLGSVAQVNLMPKTLFKNIVTAMGRLKQRVIWKWETEGDEISKQLPPNVYPVTWLPQNDLLAHPKCRAFVTHGGKLSLLEAVSNGVPVVVIPFFADQDIHGAMVKKHGYGLNLDISEITEANFYAAVTDVAENPSYRQQAKKRGQLLRDQPDDPLTRAIYWTEFILRNDGAPHLRPLARNFTWYQYHLVDVWIIMLLATSAAIFATIYVLRLMCRLCCGQKEKNSKSKKKD